MKKICGKKKDKTKKTNKTKKKNTWCGESSTSFRVLVNKRWGLLLLHWVFFFNKSIISIKTYKKLAYKTSRHHHPYLQNFNRHLAWTYIYIYIYIYICLPHPLIINLSSYTSLWIFTLPLLMEVRSTKELLQLHVLKKKTKKEGYWQYIQLNLAKIQKEHDCIPTASRHL